MLTLQDEATAAADIGFAKALADGFDARLLGGYVRPSPTMGVGYGEAPFADARFVETQQEEAGQAEARLRQTWIEACGPDSENAFLSAEGEAATTLAGLACGADLCLVARDAGPDRAGIADDLIAASAGPVLFLPAGDRGPATFATVAIGWDGSRPAARALKDALPFLRAAGKVLLITLGDATGTGLEAARDRLAAHGVAVEVLNEADAGGRSSGEALLAIAGQNGADLLVMGAYGHTRLREMLLGSATRHVLRQATIPILFSA